MTVIVPVSMKFSVSLINFQADFKLVLRECGDR